MKIVEGLYYTNDHEWVKVDEEKAYIGITDFAQNALGEIVYVELPEVDDEFEAGDVFSVIESVKAASDSYAPVSGRVVEVNEALEDSPELINEAPYENWIAVLEISDDANLANLMDDEEYKDFCDEED